MERGTWMAWKLENLNSIFSPDLDVLFCLCDLNILFLSLFLFFVSYNGIALNFRYWNVVWLTPPLPSLDRERMGVMWSSDGYRVRERERERGVSQPIFVLNGWCIIVLMVSAFHLSNQRRERERENGVWKWRHADSTPNWKGNNKPPNKVPPFPSLNNALRTRGQCFGAAAHTFWSWVTHRTRINLHKFDSC